MISDKLEGLYYQRYITKAKINELNKKIINLYTEKKHNQLNLNDLNKLIELQESL